MVIYKVTNKINGKCYIGQTILTINKRKSGHIYKSLKKSDNCYFHKAIRKYGKDNFLWEIICECKTKKELNEKEIYYIKQQKSYVKENGYNLTHGGEDNPMNYQKYRDKISKANSGELNPFFGKKHTQKTINKIKSFTQSDNHPSIKKWILKHKDGRSLIIENLEKFCRENKYYSGNFRNVKSGKYKQYRGWYFCDNVS